MNKCVYLIIILISFLAVCDGRAATNEGLLIDALRKELMMAQDILAASEQIMANADTTGDFTKYLAAKNQEIMTLRAEVNELRRQQPEIMRAPGAATAQEEIFQRELDELQAKFSSTLEELNDVQSELISLKRDYQNNIDKLAIYAQDNEHLMDERDQYRDEMRYTEQKLKDEFYAERKELQDKVDYLSIYNKELLVTKESVLTRIEKKSMPNTKGANDLTLELDHVRRKLSEKEASNIKLVEQKKELMYQMKQLTSGGNAPAVSLGAAEYEKKLKSANNEIYRLEKALNQKELHYNSLLRERESLTQR